MEILTKSIQSFLLDKFKKSIDKIGYSDLLLVDSLTIDGKDFNNERQLVTFNEVKLFKNLRYLELRNILISNYMVDILSEVPLLENIVFRNCTFRKSIIDLNVLESVKQIRIENSKNFRLEYINKLDINIFTITGEVIKSFLPLKYSGIRVLDVSCSIIDDIIGIDELNIDKLIVSHNTYNDFSNILTNLELELVVMANDGFYIEKVFRNN